MATLYDIGNAYISILTRIEYAETDEEVEALYDELDKLDVDLTTKAEAYAKIMRNKLAEAEMFKSEKDRLSRAQKSAESIAERMKTRMLETMQRIGVNDVQTGIGRWHIQQNPWSCKVISNAEVPTEYHIPQPDKIDSRAIIDHFKHTGELIPGVEVTQSTGIRFR